MLRPGKIFKRLGNTLLFNDNIFLKFMEEVGKRQALLGFDCYVSLEKPAGRSEISLVARYQEMGWNMTYVRTLTDWELKRTTLSYNRFLDLFFHGLEGQREDMIQRCGGEDGKR